LLGRPRCPADTAADLALGALVAATTTGLVAYDAIGTAGRFGAGLIAFASFGVMFLPSVRARALQPTRVVVASALLIVIAVAVPARGSRDLWSYAMDGRIASVHHASPYTHMPADYPHDALSRHVRIGWQRTGSVYGPAFVAIAAAGTTLTGNSIVENRLLFQGLAAVALAVAMVVIWKRTRDLASLAIIGLNPALLAVVNGGHNDLLVGLALLCGALLLADRRPGPGGVVLGLGALVKLVLLLPVGALLLWT